MIMYFNHLSLLININIVSDVMYLCNSVDLYGHSYTVFVKDFSDLIYKI